MTPRTRRILQVSCWHRTAVLERDARLELPHEQAIPAERQPRRPPRNKRELRNEHPDQRVLRDAPAGSDSRSADEVPLPRSRPRESKCEQRCRCNQQGTAHELSVEPKEQRN